MDPGLPQQIAMATAILLHLRYLQDGRRRDAYLAVLAVAAGLLFFEKTILIIGVLSLLTALYFTPGRGLGAWWQALRDHRSVWVAHLTLLAGYATLYLTRAPDSLSAPPSPTTILDIVQASVGEALLPAFFGGPWQWTPVGFSDASAAPGQVGQVIGYVLAAVVLELAVLVGRGAWRALAMLGLYVTAVETLLVLGRGHLPYPSIGGEYRYLSDVALVASVSLALAFLGPRGSPLVLPSAELGETAGAVRRHLCSTPVLAAIVVALVASSTVSLARFTDRWSGNPAKPFLANALHDAAANKGAVVIDTDVPKDVVWPLLGPYHQPSRLLSPVHPDLRFNQLPTDRPLAFGPDGRLVRAYVQPGVTNSPGPTASCGWRITPAAATSVRLKSKMFGWRWAVRMGYIANRAGEVTARAGLTTQILEVRHGLGEIYWFVDGAPDRVQLSTKTPGLVLCTDEVTVGSFAPSAPPGRGGRMTDRTAQHTSGGAYFPCLNAVRAVAALSVMATHSAYWTGRYERGPWNGLLARLDLGVAVFFVLSGFLLFRPYAVALAGGGPFPSTRRYLTRRLLRIAPAYIVTVGLTAAVLSDNWDRPASDWLRQLTFTQIYGSNHLLHGLSQTWSLCTEITFYLCLPALAAGAARLLGGRWRPGLLFAGLGALGAVNVAWFYLVHQLTGTVAASMGLWLPSHLIWFGAGMAMAVASAHLSHRPAREHGRLALLPSLADQLGTWWLISGALLLLASTPLAGPRSLITLTTWESVNRELLGAGIATAFIFPLVFRPEPVGLVRKVLAHGSLRWLGEISYSIFLLHVLVLDFAFSFLDWPLFTGSVLGVFATVLPVSVALAALLYRFVELPAMRWRSRAATRPAGPGREPPDSTHAASAAASDTTANDVTGSSLPA